MFYDSKADNRVECHKIMQKCPQTRSNVHPKLKLTKSHYMLILPSQLAFPQQENSFHLPQDDLVQVSVHTTDVAWINEVKANVFPTSKAIIYIESPTSRASVFANFLKMSDNFPKQFSLYVPVASRLDILSMLMESMKKKWPSRSVYALQLSTGKQSSRLKPSYAIYMPLDPKEEGVTPTHVNLSGCRSVAMEGLRMRCTNSDCPLRGASHGGSVTDDEDAEIPVEDREEPDFESLYEFGEDEGEQDEVSASMGSASQTVVAGKGDGVYAVNLFPYAAPIAAHKQVFSSVLHATQRTHLLLLTRTAHPGVMVAARESNLKVIALVQGVRHHSYEHGKALLNDLLCASKLPMARSLVASLSTGVKRMRPSDLQFITLSAPDEQPVRVREVEPKIESGWRGGFNKVPSSIEDKATKQLHRELQNHSLVLKKIDGVMHTVTTRPLRDGDVLCPMAGLTFDSLQTLRSFLDAGDINACFARSMCRIDGVCLGEDDAKNSLYRVFTGVSRYIRHYSPTKKAPNVALLLDLAAGASDELLQLVVRTRNKCGVASGTALVLNYGLEYDHEVAGKLAKEPDLKLLKTSMQQLFSRSGRCDAVAAAAEVIQDPDVQSAEDAKKKEEGDKARKQDADQMRKAEKAEAEQAEEDKAKEEAQKCKDKDNAKREDDKTAQNNDGNGLKLKPGEVSVGECQMSVPCSLVFSPPSGKSDGSLRILASKPLEGNKKIPPFTVLAVIRDGKVLKSSVAGAPQYGWTKPKQSRVCEKASEGQMSPLTILHDYMVENKVTAVAKHDAFIGTPTSLKPQEGYQFEAKDNNVRRCLVWIEACGSVEINWWVKVKEGTLYPMGLVISTRKQMILPSHGSLQLL